MLTAHGGGAKAVEAGEACFPAELRSRSFARSNEKNLPGSGKSGGAAPARPRSSLQHFQAKSSSLTATTKPALFAGGSARRPAPLRPAAPP